ncbi:hypothetical protein OH76DRAFT_322818 [Lentinus brumalis]|uniref:Uncharacterized protein n=1 Tax=Lentinus brumalis TaxID=2498619 RepID=A0A371DFM4_9APHY|nr:hypothetical protein OH76DRAFT_322818 [Polyporus brumalis]
MTRTPTGSPDIPAIGGGNQIRLPWRSFLIFSMAVWNEKLWSCRRILCPRRASRPGAAVERLRRRLQPSTTTTRALGPNLQPFRVAITTPVATKTTPLGSTASRHAHQSDFRGRVVRSCLIPRHLQRLVSSRVKAPHVGHCSPRADSPLVCRSKPTRSHRRGGHRDTMLPRRNWAENAG